MGRVKGNEQQKNVLSHTIEIWKGFFPSLCR